MNVTNFFALILIFAATQAHAQNRPEIVDGADRVQEASAIQLGNAIDIIGAAGIARNATPQVFVNGCSDKPGAFKTTYGKPPAPGCNKKLRMGETLSGVMQKNFYECLKSATGIKSSIESGRIFHSGVHGDVRHQRTGSLHNLGLAIDAGAIEVGGTLYTYGDKSPVNVEFFNKFRECWGKAANNERGGCLKNSARGKPPGTMGDEDPRHKGHLHLSVPMCEAKRKALGLYRVFFQSVLIPDAFAKDVNKVEPEKDLLKVEATRYETMKLNNGSLARLTLEDTGGEPIDVNTIISVGLRCAGQNQFTPVAAGLEVCAYDSAKFVSSENVLLIRYRTMIMTDGALSCRKQGRKTIAVNCAGRP